MNFFEIVNSQVLGPYYDDEDNDEINELEEEISE